LWYDALNNQNSILINKKTNQRKNIFLRNYKFNLTTRRKENNYVYSYLLPPKWEMLIVLNKNLKTYYIFMWSKTYFIKLPLPKLPSSLSFDKNTQQIIFTSTYLNNFTNLYSTLFNSFYKILIKPVFIKLKFKGKGYYIYKNYRNTITPQFGYSHRLYLYAFYVYVTFLSKTSLIIFGLNPSHLSTTTKHIFKWRSLNIFTGRGVRFSKQTVYKKSGKVSSYR
jgi:ribosomal protein L6P/L9E